MTRSRVATVALVVALAMAALPAGFVAAEQITTIDGEHPLTNEGKIDQFASSGVASAQLVAPKMNMTIAQKAESCGIETWSDWGQRYLCIGYQEGIDRTLRITIPAGYWAPYKETDPKLLAGSGSVELKPIAGASATQVTVEVSDPTHLVIVIDSQRSWSADARRAWASKFGPGGTEKEKQAENTTQRQQDQWQYIKTAQLSGSDPQETINASADRLQLQYDSASGDAEDWRPMPSEPGSSAGVYYMERQGSNSTTVIAETTDPPLVRYKRGASTASDVKSGAKEIPDILSDFWNDIT